MIDTSLRFVSSFSILVAAGALAMGCSATNNDSTFGNGKAGSSGSSGTSGSAGSGGTAGSAGSSGSAGSAGSIAGSSGSSGSGGTGGGNQCGGTTQNAQKIPLDIYLMLDQSGSMTSEVDPGTTKWTAVVNAMTDFLSNTPPDGLGVGMQFFSVVVGNAPASCTSSAECGAAGPCDDPIKACHNTFNNGQLIQCTSNSACPGDTCEVVGVCTGGVYACFPNDFDPGCPLGEFCQSYGQVCVNRDSCNPADYANPTVGIAPLDQNRTQLVGQFNGRTPDTNTPTGPALQGAVDYGKAWAQGGGQGHKVITILVTDGLPSVCSPVEIGPISAIAQNARNATPSIETYVIGVFAPDEAATAQSNLNQIAQAGAGRDAFIISSNVTQQLTQALDEIRGNALSCEYTIPPDTSSNAKYDEVFVQFTPSGGATSDISYVGNAGGCDPNTGGWYYDPPFVAGGPNPTKILVCPSTCTQFTSSGDASVSIKIGCQNDQIQ